MMIKMGKIIDGYEGEQYPEFYDELDDKPNFSPGEEVPATIRIKSLKETVCEDGKTRWSYEACVLEIKGKNTEEGESKDDSDYGDSEDMEAISKGLDESAKEKE